MDRITVDAMESLLPNKTPSNNPLWKTILESAPDHLLFVAPDHTIQYINHTVSGISPEEVIGESIFNFIPSEYQSAALACFNDVAQSGLHGTYETMYLMDGKVDRYFDVRVSALYESGKSFSGFVLCSNDITEQKEVEIAGQDSERHYRKLFDNMNDGFALHSIELNSEGEPVDYIFIDVNHSFEEQTGLINSDIIGKRVTEVLPGIENDPADWIGVYGKLALTGESIHFDNYAETLKKWYSVTAYSPWPGQFAVICEDVTKRKQSEEQLLILTSAIESSSSAVILCDIHGCIEYTNQRFTEITGFTHEDARGKSNSILKSGETSNEVYKELWSTISAGGEWKGQLKNKKKDGSYYWAHNSITSLTNDDNEITHYICIQDDVTHEFELTKQLNYQASHDALTGLLNRYEFEQRVTQLLKTTFGKDQHVLCYIDLDQFKVVNDSCGHKAGDELLRQVGDLFSGLIRHRDTLARLGGDEFGVFMEHCTLRQAQWAVSAIQESLEHFKFSWEGQFFRITASIGLVSANKNTPFLTEIMKHADAACFIAKDLGRNRIHVYHAEDSELSSHRGAMRWVGRIQSALEEKRFALYAQPICSLSGSDHCHYELLIRMIDEKGDIVPPCAFLPAAERFGLMVELDKWVIDQALDMLQVPSALTSQSNFISINLSGQSITQKDFMHSVIKKLTASKIDAHKICFEITETAAIKNLSAAKTFIGALKELGCRFALDDFGSGLSSFAYLKNLPVDYLKIDGMFVKDIVSDRIDYAMVKSINEIGHLMGMKTIAEFVENDRIAQLLKEINVDYAQGYGLGIPKPLDEIIEDTTLSPKKDKSKVWG